MHKPPKFVPILLLIALVTVVTFFVFRQASADKDALTSSGTIEVVDVSITGRTRARNSGRRR
jgi:hypothetical protein